MKSLAIIAIVLGCVIYTAYAQACDQSIFSDCYNPYVDCVSGANNTAQSCTCIGSYGSCLTEKACFGFGVTKDQFMTECQQLGCTAEQCSSAVAYGINAALLLASFLFALY